LDEGNYKLTESNAIARFIARKHGLDGQTEDEKVIIDLFENLTYNLHMEFVRVCHGPDFVSYFLSLLFQILGK